MSVCIKHVTGVTIEAHAPYIHVWAQRTNHEPNSVHYTEPHLSVSQTTCLSWVLLGVETKDAFQCLTQVVNTYSEAIIAASGI